MSPYVPVLNYVGMNDNPPKTNNTGYSLLNGAADVKEFISFYNNVIDISISVRLNNIRKQIDLFKIGEKQTLLFTNIILN